MARERLLYSQGSYTGIADVEQPGGEIQLRSLTNQKQYEYDYPATRPSHLYEELPRLNTETTRGQFSPTEVLARGQTDPVRNNWPAAGSGSTETSNFITNQVLRKRYNPLYEGIANRFPNTKPQEVTTKPTRHIRCLFFVTILCLMVALGSMGLSVYILFITDSQSGLRNTDMEQFKALYDRLSDKMSRELRDLQDQTASLQRNIDDFQKEAKNLQQKSDGKAEKFFKNLETLSTRYNQLSGNITDFNNSVTSRLEKITKMEGPRGPPGVGNLSACFHYNDTDKLTGHTSSGSQYTDWLPQDNVLQKYVVMGAGCSVYGGSFHSLTSRKVKGDMSQYQCECRGSAGRLNYRLCTIYMWLCPIIS